LIQLQAVEFLTDRGADVNAQDPDGCTPLHLAAGWGSKEVCEYLLSRGADKSIVDKKGRTAEAIAELNERPAIAHFLRRWLQVVCSRLRGVDAPVLRLRVPRHTCRLG
jgi:ankyrin repeat protein